MSPEAIATWAGIAVTAGIAWYAKRQTASDVIKAKADADRAETAVNKMGELVAEVIKHGSRDEERIERERREHAEQAQARKVRLWMFAHEAVELHKRWVLYAGQAISDQGISNSRPFEWIEFSTVEEYLRVGGRQNVVEAVYRVKQLNCQMDIQVSNAQESVRTNSFRHSEDRRLIVGFLFNDDEWHPVCRSIRVLLDAAEQAGNDMKAEREAFETRVSGADKLRNALRALR